jgi:hypothetical protein
MFRGGIELEKETLPDRFAYYFDEKVRKLIDEVTIDDNVNNGKRNGTTINS